MDARPLFYEGETTPALWQCGKCKEFFGARTAFADEAIRRIADDCCAPRHCTDCGVAVDRYRVRCEPCWYAWLVATTEKLETWDGWVFWDGAGPQDGYFENLGALLEWHAEETADRDEEDAPPALPEWVFPCKPTPFRIDIGSAIDNHAEAHYEGVRDRLTGVNELHAAVQRFNDANADVVSYSPNYGRMVRVPR